MLLALVDLIEPNKENYKTNKILFYKVFDEYLPGLVRKSDFDSFRNQRFIRLLLMVTTKLLGGGGESVEQEMKEIKIIMEKNKLLDKKIEMLKNSIEENDQVEFKFDDDLEGKRLELKSIKEKYESKWKGILDYFEKLKELKVKEPIEFDAMEFLQFKKANDLSRFEFKNGKLDLISFINSIIVE